MTPTALLPQWQGQDVFILGGGPSLKAFDVSRLAGKCVVGCNDAYQFGPRIVSILCFGDTKWFRCHQLSLRRWPNPIVTNQPMLAEEEGLIVFRREDYGFHVDALGWNGNTGAMAINLALILGAARIFLLGFDMKLGEDGQSNWHPNPLSTPTNEVHYARYKENFARCLGDWIARWSQVQIINLNPESALSCFPRRKWDDVFGEAAQ